MIRPLLISLLFSVVSSFASAQTTFSLEYHGGTGDEAVDGAENPAGNLVVLGGVYASSNSDLVVSEISPNGVLLQTFTYATPTNELPKSITLTSDGGYFITGSVFTSPTDYDLLVIKLDSAFNTVFHKRFSITGGNESGNRAFEVAPGLYGVTGSIGLGGSTKPAFLILDDNGDIRHQAYLTTNQFASPDYSGRYLGNGVTALVHLTNAFTLLDSSGAILASCPTNIGLFTTDVFRTSTGSYACLAASEYGAPLGGSLSLGIIDSALNSWTAGIRLKINAHDLAPVAMAEDGSGNIYVAANATSLSSGNTVPLLIKTDSGGNLIWSYNFLPSGAPSAAFRQIKVTSDGGIIILGNSGPWNNRRMYVTKVDTAGMAPCNRASYPLTPLSINPIGQTLHTAYTGTLPPASAITGNPVSLALTTDALCNGGGTGIEDQPVRPVIRVIPVMSERSFRIESESNGQGDLSVYATNGSLVLEKRIMTGETISAENWLPGVYVFRIRLTTGETACLRVLREG